MRIRPLVDVNNFIEELIMLNTSSVFVIKHEFELNSISVRIMTSHLPPL